MASYASQNNWRPATWRDYRNLQALLHCALLIGPAIFLYGVFNDYRDRPSLQWPKAAGTIMDSEWHYNDGRQSHYQVAVSYDYEIGNQHYTGRQITLWNPNLLGDGNTAMGFVAAHPVHSTVDVYYDPRQPQRAVLVPGADEAGNRRSLWSGTVIFGLFAVIVLWTQKFFARVVAEKKAETAGHRWRKIAELSQGFVSYEPAGNRKLYCFPNQDSLFEVLGKNGAKIQDWKPEDRVIDATGRVYRLVKSLDNKFYDLEETGETWSVEKLLPIAEADARWIKTDAGLMRQRVNNAPLGHEIAVLIKCIDDFPTGPGLLMIGVGMGLFLLFAAAVLMAGKVIVWLQNVNTH